MYKVVFFKLFLFILYMTAGLISKKANNTKNITDTVYNKNKIKESNLSIDTTQIGVATNWVNPFITRYKKPNTATRVKIQLNGTKILKQKKFPNKFGN